MPEASDRLQPLGHKVLDMIGHHTWFMVHDQAQSWTYIVWIQTFFFLFNSLLHIEMQTLDFQSCIEVLIVRHLICILSSDTNLN